ncbi:MAG: iron ABC transporter permease [Dehalococcoidales bacterium]|nr:iron ABC transporter permease [Dehalococcoidales bacterium]
MAVVTGRVSSFIGRLGRAGRGVPTSRPPVIIWLPVVFIAIAILLPQVYLVMRALGTGAETWELLFRTRTLAILGRTVALVVAVTTLSLAISLPLAWLTSRTDLPFRRMWLMVTALPLVIPSYVAGFVIIAALGPRGMLQQLLAGPFGLERLPEIYGFPGALLTVTAVSYPYLLLALQASIRGIDPCLEEASRSLGHGSWTTFRRVTLPQLRPAIAAGSLLVALYTIRDFGAVSLMRYETFTWAIYLQYQTSFDRMAAAALSMVLVALAIIALLIEGGTRGRARYHRSTVGVTHSQTEIRLGWWRWPATSFCATISLLTVVMPMSILSYWAIRGISTGEPFRLAWDYALNSAYASGLAAIIIAVAAIPVAILAVRYSGRISQLLERATYIGFALPGIVIALALVFFGANYATPIYQTLGVLLFAYLILFLPQAVGSIRSSLLQVSPRVEEAARSLGRSATQALVSITLPLAKPGILIGAALVFLTTMKELPATLLLSPIGFRTLATSVWSATAEAFFARAAVSALLLIALSSIPMALLVIRQRRKEI